VWQELRSLSPLHAGMSYDRIEALGGIQWPCPDEHMLEPSFLHGRLWSDNPAELGRPAPFSVVLNSPPVDVLDDDFPMRLTTGRRLDSYNTGVQTGRFSSPRRRGETIDLFPADAAALGVVPGERVRIVSRRGAVEAPVRLDDGLRPGLAFMTLHFPDEVDVNVLTIDAVDPKSGTAEFKASAIRIERIPAADSATAVPAATV
jgi:predicted molibdopterin-dependent oxidoreductase YjgC